MIFEGLRKDRDTEEIIKYELRLNREFISCLYTDRYGNYICTLQGKMYKVDHTIEYLKEEIGLGL